MSLFPASPDRLGPDIERLERLFEEADETGDEHLTEWEQDFLESLSDRVAEYGDRTRISERQWEVVERIEGKLGI